MDVLLLTIFCVHMLFVYPTEVEGSLVATDECDLHMIPGHESWMSTSTLQSAPPSTSDMEKSVEEVRGRG